MHNHTKKINNQDSSTKSPSTTIEFIKDKDMESKIDSKENTIKPESTKLDSTRESIAESSKLESKKDSKNKDKVRFDENGDEIMYEAKHNLTWWDYIMYSIMFLVGILTTYGGIDNFLSNKIDGVFFIMLLIFGIPCICVSLHFLVYVRKNRFYVTNSGIGFERRKWFRLQKRFFKFGEVGVAMNVLPAFGTCDTPTQIFMFCPIHLTIKPMFLPRLRDKNYKHYIFCKVLTEFYRDDKIAIFNFIRQKTKEALESKGIHISDSELKDKIKHLIYKDI